jgi:hypothetical protein
MIQYQHVETGKFKNCILNPNVDTLTASHSIAGKSNNFWTHCIFAIKSSNYGILHLMALFG